MTAAASIPICSNARGREPSITTWAAVTSPRSTTRAPRPSRMRAQSGPAQSDDQLAMTGDAVNGSAGPSHSASTGSPDHTLGAVRSPRTAAASPSSRARVTTSDAVRVEMTPATSSGPASTSSQAGIASTSSGRARFTATHASAARYSRQVRVTASPRSAIGASASTPAARPRASIAGRNRCMRARTLPVP